MPAITAKQLIHAQSRVVEIAQDLLMIDTTNAGPESEETKGEQIAAKYVADIFRQFNHLRVEWNDIIGPNGSRSSFIARIAGRNRKGAGMAVHGHLDVVPAGPGWNEGIDPFAAQITDSGDLYGRGAIDMKGQVAIQLATFEMWDAAGITPERDIVFSAFADEEAGGILGARWIVENYPEYYSGIDTVVGGEVGGFSFRPPGTERDTYLYQTAERGMDWWRLIASGEAGHGSFLYRDQAVVNLARAILAVHDVESARALTATSDLSLTTVARNYGFVFNRNDPDALIERFGPMSKWFTAAIRNTANFTTLRGGTTTNVLPAEAEAGLDIRTLPGRHGLDFTETLARVAAEHGATIKRDLSFEPWESKLNSPVVTAIERSIALYDKNAFTAPFQMGAGTDGKSYRNPLGASGRALQHLGSDINTYGFGPLPLPPTGYDLPGQFHGPNEHVPVASLRAGVRIFSDFLEEWGKALRGTQNTATAMTQQGLTTRPGQGGGLEFR